MTPYITNSTLVDTPHLGTLFHTGEQMLYLRPQRVNEFEVIAELLNICENPQHLRLSAFYSFPT